MAKRKPAPKSSGPGIHPFVGLFLIVSGTFLVGISTAHNILKLRSLRLDQATVQAYVQEQQSHPAVDADVGQPAHIFIKWFVDVDIEPALIENGRWTISSDRASYLISSGRMGSGGNIILYGHNTRPILGNIRALKGGETITLTSKKGEVREYTIESLREVSPTQTDLLQPTDEEVLTIYTCSGPLDSRRFVVRAIPKK